jgi:hypothetical protein
MDNPKVKLILHEALTHSGKKGDHSDSPLLISKLLYKTSSSHLPTTFRTLATALRTFLAMIMAVFSTFLSTPVTDFRTQTANIF